MKEILTSDDLYLIQLCCIHIAIKMEETLVMPLEVIKRDVGKDKFSSEEIRRMEYKIL